MEMKNMTVADLAALTASDAPAPGGGSISALSAAFSAALAAMVARLTVSKAGYEETIPAMNELMAKCDALMAKLLDDVQKDSNSFDAYMLAMKMPKETEEEKAVRRAAMQDALKHAAEVPFAVAEKAASLLPYCRTVVAKGNPNSITDGLVAAMCARTGALGALYNVKINLGGIKDEAFVADLKVRVHALEEQVNTAETEIRALATDLA